MLALNRSSSGGAVAQLGARLDGIEEVVGSNPIGSTKHKMVRPGDIGDSSYRRHRLHFWVEGIFHQFTKRLRLIVAFPLFSGALFSLPPRVNSRRFDDDIRDILLA